jgi:hypothetical protein
MTGRWEEEPTELMPRTLLAELLALSKKPPVQTSPGRLLPSKRLGSVVRTPNVEDVSHADDFVEEESPSLLIPIEDVAHLPRPEVASPAPYTSRLATVLATCVITLGCALVLTMLML